MSSSSDVNRLPIECSPNGPVSHISSSNCISAAPQSKPRYTRFDDEDDLNDHPDQHFLSSMYDYEDWASDNENDGDETEWDAGITDFPLFDEDRPKTQESPEQLEHPWDSFISSQQSALQGSVQRRQSRQSIDTTRPPLPFHDIPGLTPDSSPNWRDDLDRELHDQVAPRSRVPDYLTITVTPPSPHERTIGDNEELPLSFYAAPKSPRQIVRRLERPGLRHARTMSGKLHSWRRPSWNIYSVGEDPDAERTAELGMMRKRESLNDLRGQARRQV